MSVIWGSLSTIKKKNQNCWNVPECPFVCIVTRANFGSWARRLEGVHIRLSVSLALSRNRRWEKELEIEHSVYVALNGRSHYERPILPRRFE
jgi:hypothetical protein